MDTVLNKNRSEGYWMAEYSEDLGLVQYNKPIALSPFILGQ